MSKSKAHHSVTSPGEHLSTERLLRSIDGMGAGIWDWDIRSGETYFNEAWAAMLGYELSELEPLTIDTWTRLTQPDDLKRAQKELDQYFKGESPTYDIEIRMQHKAGHWVWIRDRGKVYAHTDQGEPLRMAGTHIDISARKAFELKAQTRQELQEITRLLSLSVLKTRMEDMTTTIEEGLGKICTFLGADRAYIFQLDHETELMHNTHEWVREGISEEKENLQNLPWDMFPWWMEHVLKNKTLHIPDVQLMPEEHKELRDMLAAQSIRSLAVVPIPGRERTLGFLGIDFVSQQWDMTRFVEDSLWFVTGIFSGAIERRNDEDRILTLLEQTRESYVTISDQTESLIIETDESLTMTFLNEAQKKRYDVGTQVLGRKPNDVFSAPVRQVTKFSRKVLANQDMWRGMFLNTTSAGELVIESTYIKRLPTKRGYIKVGEDITDVTKQSEWMKLANITHRSSTRIKISELDMKAGLDQIVTTPRGFILPQHAAFLPNPDHNPFDLETVSSVLGPDSMLSFTDLTEYWSSDKGPTTPTALVIQDHQGVFQKDELENGARTNSRLEALGVRIQSKYFDYGWFILWHNNQVRYYSDDQDLEYLRELGGTLSDLFNSLEMSDRIQTQARAEHLTQLAAGVAHEIRNPLATISLALEVLQIDNPPEESTTATSLKIIESSVSRAARIVEDLMKLQAPQRPGEDMACICIQTLVDEAIALTSFHLRKAKIDIQREFPSSDVCVAATKDEMLRVLVNILLNSIQAIERQGVIKISLDEGDGYVKLMVADTGRSLEPDELQSLTKPFYTTKKGQHGSGMGLFLSKEIMTSFGGDIEFSNNNMGGLTVILTFLKQSDMEG